MMIIINCHSPSQQEQKQLNTTQTYKTCNCANKAGINWWYFYPKEHILQSTWENEKHHRKRSINFLCCIKCVFESCIIAGILATSNSTWGQFMRLCRSDSIQCCDGINLFWGKLPTPGRFYNMQLPDLFIEKLLLPQKWAITLIVLKMVSKW